jgi:hypothetical protein
MSFEDERTIEELSAQPAPYDYWEYTDAADQQWRQSKAYAAERRNWEPQSLDSRVQAIGDLAIDRS